MEQEELFQRRKSQTKETNKKLSEDNRKTFVGAKEKCKIGKRKISRNIKNGIIDAIVYF
ncbi:hypothetical protein LGFR6_07850 [Lactococcus garvieae]